jgi:hypothetical protein
MLIILRQEFLMEIYGIFSDIIKESGLCSPGLGGIIWEKSKLSKVT